MELYTLCFRKRFWIIPRKHYTLTNEDIIQFYGLDESDFEDDETYFDNLD